MYDHSVILNRSTTLKVLCAPPLHPFLPLSTWQPLTPLFLLFQNVMYLGSYSMDLFKLASYTLQYGFKVPSCVFKA